MRWFRALKVVAVLALLMSGMVGCSYHNYHGGGGRHEREDVYVHREGPPHYHY